MKIAQTSTDYKVRPDPNGFRVIDKNWHNHGVYPTRDAADEHILTLTKNRAQTRRATHDLVLDASAAACGLLLAVALLLPGPVQARSCPAGTVPAIVYDTNGSHTICVQVKKQRLIIRKCNTPTCWCEHNPRYCRKGGR